MTITFEQAVARVRPVRYISSGSKKVSDFEGVTEVGKTDAEGGDWTPEYYAGAPGSAPSMASHFRADGGAGGGPGAAWEAAEHGLGVMLADPWYIDVNPNDPSKGYIHLGQEHVYTRAGGDPWALIEALWGWREAFPDVELVIKTAAPRAGDTARDVAMHWRIFSGLGAMWCPDAAGAGYNAGEERQYIMVDGYLEGNAGVVAPVLYESVYQEDWDTPGPNGWTFAAWKPANLSNGQRLHPAAQSWWRAQLKGGVSIALQNAGLVRDCLRRAAALRREAAEQQAAKLEGKYIIRPWFGGRREPVEVTVVGAADGQIEFKTYGGDIRRLSALSWADAHPVRVGEAGPVEAGGMDVGGGDLRSRWSELAARAAGRGPDVSTAGVLGGGGGGAPAIEDTSFTQRPCLVASGNEGGWQDVVDGVMKGLAWFEADDATVAAGLGVAPDGGVFVVELMQAFGAGGNAFIAAAQAHDGWLPGGKVKQEVVEMVLEQGLMGEWA